jgi:hypothetical protein
VAWHTGFPPSPAAAAQIAEHAWRPSVEAPAQQHADFWESHPQDGRREPGRKAPARLGAIFDFQAEMAVLYWVRPLAPRFPKMRRKQHAAFRQVSYRAGHRGNPMRSRSIDALWMGSAFCAALALAVGVIIALGAEQRGVDAAVAATARLMFLLFWPAYSGGALVALFGSAFQPLKRHAREFGLAFAAALLVHLSLVGDLCLIGAAPGVPTFVFFGAGAVWAYLLALFSFPRLHLALGPRNWWLLSNLGMSYLAYAFIADFLKQPLHGGIKHVVEYLPFAVLSLAGPSLRLAAFAQRIRRSSRDSPHN